LSRRRLLQVASAKSSGVVQKRADVAAEQMMEVVKAETEVHKPTG
jgi:hypothetical protein